MKHSFGKVQSRVPRNDLLRHCHCQPFTSVRSIANQIRYGFITQIVTDGYIYIYLITTFLKMDYY